MPLTDNQYLSYINIQIRDLRDRVSAVTVTALDLVTRLIICTCVISRTQMSQLTRIRLYLDGITITFLSIWGFTSYT